MIDKNIAKEYVETLKQFPDYQITIIDIKTKIIYSTDSQHSHAFFSNSDIKKFIFSDSLVLENKDDNFNYVLIKVFEGEQISCCIQITGRENNLLPIATALKMSLEIRLKYDKIQSKENKKININEQLIHELINEKANLSQVINLYEQSHHSIDIPRKLIMLIPDDAFPLDTLIHMNLYYDSKEDIIGRLNSQLLILKDISKSKKKEKEYTNMYIDFLIKNTSFKGRILIAYTSYTYDKIRFSYQTLIWLKKYMSSHKLNESVLFFSDYIDQYCLSLVPFEFFQNLFSSYEMDDEFLREFIQVTDVLIHNNYNIVKSSKELFVHKNTLLYRLAKIKKEFNVDPINSEADRSFIKLLNYYLKNLLVAKGALTDETN